MNDKTLTSSKFLVSPVRQNFFVRIAEFQLRNVQKSNTLNL